MKLGKGSGRAREVLGRGHLEHRQLRQERGHEVHEQAPPTRRVPLPPPLQRLQEKKPWKKSVSNRPPFTATKTQVHAPGRTAGAG